MGKARFLTPLQLRKFFPEVYQIMWSGSGYDSARKVAEKLRQKQLFEKNETAR